MQPISNVGRSAEAFLRKHAVGKTRRDYGRVPVSGEFSLHTGQSSADLFGMIDAVYILFTLNKLDDRTDQRSRSIWAKRIIACQDDLGWFSKLRMRGYCLEHATAYAIGALKLLETGNEEHYLEAIRPLVGLLPILVDRSAFVDWIERLGFHFSIGGLVNKNWGWHHVWRGSHVGGGVAAAIAMTSDLFDKWWPGRADPKLWFKWYFEWLDAHANPASGFWQRAFWNRFYRKPTIIDMGGAAHFLWLYDKFGRPFPHPEQTMLSTLMMQRREGLYSNHPFCIDLDGNFCMVRSFLQLPPSMQETYRARVHQAIEANFKAIVDSLTRGAVAEIYGDLHGLPGVLAALAECVRLPKFKHAALLSDWQHPLDRVWWL